MGENNPAAKLLLEDLMSALRKLRELARMTQIRLSRESGVTRMKIQLAETGQGELSTEEEQKVRAVLFGEVRRQAVEIRHALAQTREVRVSASP